MRRCRGNGKKYDEYLAAAASRSFRPRALGIGDIERNGCQRCGVLKRPYILFDGSRAGQRRDRVVRRCGKLHLVVAYLVGRLRPGNNGADLFVRGCLYGPQYRSTHHRLHAALIARALLPVGPQRPFPHPATCQDINKRADAVYAEGFEYAVSYPRNAGTESPYDNMTVEWSIAHPTTFMSDAMYEDWEEWTSVADWLYNHHPNLWGTSRQATTILAR